MTPRFPLLVLLAITLTFTGNACNATDDQPAGVTVEVTSDDAAQASDENRPVVGEADEDGWVCMFNGEDLTGWTPKFSGYELGDNFRDTFRAEDGKLVVNYENWDRFNGEFGHIFFTGTEDFGPEFSHYIMQIECRFVGEQVPGGPGWAWRNNGIMFHGQPADSMGLHQNFPASVEAQMLAGPDNPEDGDRSAGNVATPGTHIHHNGELTHAHVIDFGGPTIRGDAWALYEIEVHGSERVIHRINGEVVAEYGALLLDENDTSCAGHTEIERRGTAELGIGTISLQAETAPCEFRNIRIRVLEAGEE